LQKSTISFNFSIYSIEITFSKFQAKQIITKLKKSVYLEDFKIRNCIATLAQFIKSIEILVTSNFRHYKLTITISNSSNKIANKRLERDFAIETFSIKKIR